MTSPGTDTTDEDDDPGDGLTTGQWLQAVAAGERDPDEYGNA